MEQLKSAADKAVSAEESEKVRSLERSLAAHVSTIQSMTEEVQVLTSKVNELEMENAKLNSHLQIAVHVGVSCICVCVCVCVCVCLGHTGGREGGGRSMLVL